MRWLIKLLLLVLVVALAIDNRHVLGDLYRSVFPKEGSRFDSAVGDRGPLFAEAARAAGDELARGLDEARVPKAEALAVLPLTDDVERRATGAIEAALNAAGWKVVGRASLDAALAGSDLRATIEDLWSRASPSDVFAKAGVERVVFGRVESVTVRSARRIETRLALRGLSAKDDLLFDVSLDGVAGPEPTLADYAALHPWRVVALVALAAVAAVFVASRGRAIPGVARAREEAADRAEVGAARHVAQRLLAVMSDLRRHQDDLQRAGDDPRGKRVFDAVEAIERVRARIDRESRADRRAIERAGGVPDAALARLARAAGDLTRPARGADATADPLDELEAAIRELRDDYAGKISA